MSKIDLIAVVRTSDEAETAKTLKAMFGDKYTIVDFKKEVGCVDEVVITAPVIEEITVDDNTLDDLVVGKAAIVKYVMGRWYSNETYVFKKDGKLFIAFDEYKNI